VRSLSLNGTNKYLTTPSSTSLNITGGITVEAWIKLNSIDRRLPSLRYVLHERAVN
jgi:hypothetical protein